MLQHDSDIPLYIQIKNYIRLNIEAGTFTSNSRLPSERQLAAQFSVSRLTVSKALNELAQEGYVYSRVGKGTFVSPQKIDQELSNLTSFTEEMSQRGQHARSVVLRAEHLPASPDVARALNIVSGVQLLVLKRVRYADDRPLAVEQSSLVGAMCPDILKKHDFATESLYAVLQENYGIYMTSAQQTIEARKPSSEELRLLHIDPDVSILGITRITLNQDDVPVEYVESAYRGDLYKFRAKLYV